VIGEEVLMAFKLKRNSEAAKLKGGIAHATRWGIGVEFTEKGPQLDEKIRDIIQRI
jgi:Tfp pilus assembly protein PilZ